MDKELLEAIGQMMEAQEKKLSDMMEQQKGEILQAVDAKLAQQKAEILDESTHRMKFLLDTEVVTKFNLLAEGQQTILETLAPKSRVEELEDEVKFLKSIVRQMNEDIQKLKKAN